MTRRRRLGIQSLQHPGERLTQLGATGLREVRDVVDPGRNVEHPVQRLSPVAAPDRPARAAAGLGGAMHRLDLGTERQRDGSADHRLGFSGKALALTETAREIGRQGGAGADDRIAGKGIAETNGRQLGDARVCRKLGKHLTRHQRQG